MALKEEARCPNSSRLRTGMSWVRSPEESRLEPRSAEVLTGRLAGGRDLYFRTAAGEGRQRDDFWKWCAALCAVCLLGEFALLLGFRS